MRKYNVTVNGTTYEVEVEEVGVTEASDAPRAQAPAAPAHAEVKAPASAGNEGKVKVTSPMPGTILSVAVSVGQSVKKGDTICVLEAMKMENAIPAPCDGTVASVSAAKGASVAAGDILAALN